MIQTGMKKQEYLCQNCGFRFSRNVNIVVSKCPYCNKQKKIITAQQNSAQNLLEGSDTLFS